MASTRFLPPLCGLLIVAGGCAHVFYAPNVPASPLLREGGELRVSGYVGGGNDVEQMAQGAVAAAVGPRLAVYAAGYWGRGSDRDNDGRVSAGRGTAWDVGLGYYRQTTRHVGMELIGGVQYGRGRNSWDDGRWSVAYRAVKPFAQFNVGYRGRFFELALAQRFGRLAYFEIRSPDPLDDFGRPEWLGDLVATRPSFLYEPALTVRLGSERVKVGVDVAFSRSLSSTHLRSDPAVLALSLHYTHRRR